MSPRPSRHRRPDAAARTPGEALLARLGHLAPAKPLPQPVGSPPAATALAAPGSGPTGGWVPGRPALPRWSPEVAGVPPVRVRWVPSRRAATGLVLVLLVAGLVAVLLLWRAQPAARAAPPVHRVAATASPVDAPASTEAPMGEVGPEAVTGAISAARADVVVQVVGAVHRPGLVRLPTGSRVADAVRAAGGLTATAQEASVNLARVLVDGEQLLVQRRGRPPILPAPGPAVGSAGGAAGSATGGSPTAPVDLNTATLDQLDGLPGIGPVLAQRILDWRTANGRFDSVDELGEVSGIGEAHLSDLRPLVVV